MEALLVLVIPALVKLLELVNNKDWLSAAKIVAAGLIGLAAGYFGFRVLPLLKV